MNKRVLWLPILIIFMMILGNNLIFAQNTGGLMAFCSEGILDVSGDPLQGNAQGGDLIQLIYIGPDGIHNPPTSQGQTTGDDLLLGTSYVGAGYPFEAAAGRFSDLFSHALLQPDTTVYLRAWNYAEFTGEESDLGYGDSQPITITNSGNSLLPPQHNFTRWSISYVFPVELATFMAVAQNGYVLLEWVTESETDNAGFYLYRSTHPDGEQTRLNDQMIHGQYNSQVKTEYSYKDEKIDENTIYYYWLADVGTDGLMSYHGPVEVQTKTLPVEFALYQNYPNPFNPTTTIGYSIKDQGPVHLSIYNIRGQLVRRLVDEIQFAGHYNILWNGRDDHGVRVPSGTYVYVLETESFKDVKKMVLMK